MLSFYRSRSNTPEEVAEGGLRQTPGLALFLQPPASPTPGHPFRRIHHRQKRITTIELLAAE